MTLSQNYLRPSITPGTAVVPAIKAKKLGIGIRLFPIFFMMFYLVMTELLFILGPWPYPIRDGTLLYGFMLLANVALLLGYTSAAFGRPRGYRGPWSVRRIVVWSVAVNLVLLLPTSAFRTGSWIPDFRAGLQNPGTAYSYSQSLRSMGNPIVEYVRILVGPLLVWSTPLAIFYRKRLSRPLVILAYLAIIGEILIFVAMGTNKGIADIVLIATGLVATAHLAGVSKLSRFEKTVLTVIAAIVLLLFLVFFTRGMMTRSGSGAISGYSWAIGIYADPDNILVRNMPDSVQVGIYGLSSYLTQGYYALYLALKEPFVPTWGVGNSTFLVNQVMDLFPGSRIEQRPYPMRIEKYGWDAYGLWSSIYAWLASDFTFPGTILIIFLIGRLFAMSWLDSLRGENPFAVAMFAQFLIMLFYFPANNQVLQSGAAWTGFWVTLALWALTRYSSPKRAQYVETA